MLIEGPWSTGPSFTAYRPRGLCGWSDNDFVHLVKGVLAVCNGYFPTLMVMSFKIMIATDKIVLLWIMPCCWWHQCSEWYGHKFIVEAKQVLINWVVCCSHRWRLNTEIRRCIKPAIEVPSSCNSCSQAQYHNGANLFTMFCCSGLLLSSYLHTSSPFKFCSHFSITI